MGSKRRSKGLNGGKTSQSAGSFDLFTPTEEHGALRDMLAGFVKTKVDPQVRFC